MASSYSTQQPRFDKKSDKSNEWAVRVKIYELCREQGHQNGTVPESIADEIDSLYGHNGSTAEVVKPGVGKKVSQGSCTDRWKQSRIMVAIEKKHNIPWQWLEKYEGGEAQEAVGDEAEASQEVKRAVEAQQDVPWRDVEGCLRWLKERSQAHHQTLKKGPRASVGDLPATERDSERPGTSLPPNESMQNREQSLNDLFPVTAPDLQMDGLETHTARNDRLETPTIGRGRRPSPNQAAPVVDSGMNISVNSLDFRGPDADVSWYREEMDKRHAVERQSVDLRKENARLKVANAGLNDRVAQLQAQVDALQQDMRTT